MQKQQQDAVSCGRTGHWFILCISALSTLLWLRAHCSPINICGGNASRIIHSETHFKLWWLIAWDLDRLWQGGIHVRLRWLATRERCPTFCELFSCYCFSKGALCVPCASTGYLSLVMSQHCNTITRRWILKQTSEGYYVATLKRHHFLISCTKKRLVQSL